MYSLVLKGYGTDFWPAPLTSVSVRLAGTAVRAVRCGDGVRGDATKCPSKETAVWSSLPSAPTSPPGLLWRHGVALELLSAAARCSPVSGREQRNSSFSPVELVK